VLNNIADFASEDFEWYGGALPIMKAKAFYADMEKLEEKRAEAHLNIWNAQTKKDTEYWTLMYNWGTTLALQEKEIGESAGRVTTEYDKWALARTVSVEKAQEEVEWIKRYNAQFAIAVDMAHRLEKISPLTAAIANLKTISKIDISASLRDADDAVSNIAANITQRYQNIANMTSSLIGAPLRAAFSEGQNALEAFGNAFLDMLTTLAVKAATFGILSSIFSPFSAAVGGLGGFLGFGGPRAMGGPVEPGNYYKVNENTPNSEYFVPTVPGQIIPNAGTTINISFNGNVTDQRYVDEFILPRIQRTLRLAR
jgi:hypothetical protein